MMYVTHYLYIYILAGVPAIHAGYGMLRTMKPLALSHAKGVGCTQSCLQNSLSYKHETLDLN